MLSGGQWKIKLGKTMFKDLSLKTSHSYLAPLPKYLLTDTPLTLHSVKKVFSGCNGLVIPKTDIHHALNGSGEQKIGPFFVDGVCGKTVYEFNECFWHECSTCYPLDRTKIKNPTTQQSTRELHIFTLDKIKYLEGCGYTVVIKWEHELKIDHKHYVELNNL